MVSVGADRSVVRADRKWFDSLPTRGVTLCIGSFRKLAPARRKSDPRRTEVKIQEGTVEETGTVAG